MRYIFLFAAYFCVFLARFVDMTILNVGKKLVSLVPPLCVVFLLVYFIKYYIQYILVQLPIADDMFGPF